MATVFLAVGSNVGDRRANIQKALAFLKENEEIDVLSVSDLIETEAVGGPPQGRFLNGAVKIETDLKPLELLGQLKMTERRLGRAPLEAPPLTGRAKSEANGPRPIDLDILFYDDVVIVEGKHLTIPHPRLPERYFVLKPLAEIAPDFVHPRLRKTIKELYEDCCRGGATTRVAPTVP